MDENVRDRQAGRDERFHVEQSKILCSPNTDKLMAALAKAQTTMVVAAEDSQNPHFKSSYASLASVRRALQPASELGIAVIQVPVGSESLVTRITLGDQWVECTTPVIQMQRGPQAYGSALTYARRYALMSIFGLAPDDDDGNAAQESPDKTDKPPVKKTRSRRLASDQSPHHPNASPAGSQAVSEAQLKRLFAICRQYSVSNDALKGFMASEWGIDSTRKLSYVQYNDLCDVIIPEGRLSVPVITDDFDAEMNAEAARLDFDEDVPQ